MGALRIFAFLLTALLLVGTMGSTKGYAAPSEGAVRMNVMLVIDGSGSLHDTDGGKNRYKAINLFLAMLTNEGNNVGAIVFDDKTDPFLMYSEIAPLSGKADKLALAKKIEKAGTRNDTNIGGALLAAVKECEIISQQNGLPSVVILFSDGRTDVKAHDGLTKEEAMQESLNAKESAIEQAQLAGIPVYSICLNASATADPSELEEISNRTSGAFVSVKNAKDLASAFESFYSLIFSTHAKEIQEVSFSEDGKLDFNIEIPSYGAEEVNIILDNTHLKNKSITAPGGVLTDEQIDDYTMTGGQYEVIKLVDPESGIWQVNLTGVPDEAVTINVLYNIDSTVHIKTDNDIYDYDVGDNAVIQANLYQNGAEITDSSVTSEYTAKMTLVNTAGGAPIEVDMVPGSNGTFQYTLHGKEYTSYRATIEMTFGTLSLVSNEIQLNFGNTPPGITTARHEDKKIVTPVSGKSYALDMKQFFFDAQDKQLTYSIVSSQLVKDTVDLDPQTGMLNINTGKSKSGEVVIQAADSQGATAQMTVYMKVTNLSGVIFGTILAGIAVAAIVILSSVYAATNRAWHGTFTVRVIGGYGAERSHGDFRGKVVLKKLGLGECGIDGCFAAIGSNQMEFRSKKPVFTKGGLKSDPKRVSLMSGTTKIFADEACTRGIQVEVKPKLPGGGFGGFGGLGGGGRVPNAGAGGGFGGLNDLNRKPQGPAGGGFGGLNGLGGSGKGGRGNSNPNQYVGPFGKK